MTCVSTSIDQRLNSWLQLSKIYKDWNGKQCLFSLGHKIKLMEGAIQRDYLMQKGKRILSSFYQYLLWWFPSHLLPPKLLCMLLRTQFHLSPNHPTPRIGLFRNPNNPHSEREANKQFLPLGRWGHVDLVNWSWGLPLCSSNHQIDCWSSHLSCKECIWSSIRTYIKNQKHIQRGNECKSCSNESLHHNHKSAKLYRDDGKDPIMTVADRKATELLLPQLTKI